MNQQKTGEFLRELRTEKNLTQEQLSELLGVTNRSVSRWENGNNMPDLDILIELSKFYGVGVDEILDGQRKPERDALSEEAAEKIADYANAEEKLRQTKIVRAMLAALIMSAVEILLQFFEVEGAIASFLKGFSSGLNFGIILWLLIFLSRFGPKIRAAKLNLKNKVKGGRTGK